MTYKTHKTSLGYYSVSPLPSIETLQKHYSEKYYQHDLSHYQHQYTTDEQQYFKIESQVAEHIIQAVYSTANSIIDVGAGEGYFSKYFFEQQWDVTTCDYSTYGMEQHNPPLLAANIQGDVMEILDKKINSAQNYDLINLKNVLEHVPDPILLLAQLKSLMHKQSLLRIVVPNDYSSFQSLLLEQDKTENTWFCPPEHLHYFSFASLRKLLESSGYKIEVMMADVAIELYLLNEHSNYAKDRRKGRAAHLAKIATNNFIFEKGIEAYIRYFSAAAEVDLGRQIVVFAKKNTH